MTSPVGSVAIPTPQLDGIVATQSSICLLSADDNRLAYRGYDVAELAENGTYEETAYLLLAGKLPARGELDRFVLELRARQKLPRRVQRLLRELTPAADPMALLRTAVSALALQPTTPATDISIPGPTLDLMAQMPALVAAIHRLGRGEKPLTPRRSLGVAANLLFLLGGEKPARELARSVEVGLSLRADNELNPSTFAARVTAATKADLHGCITAALAALAGPLHGGHALAVYRLLDELASADGVTRVVDARLATGKPFPGFGHPVYRGEDPRTAAMHRAAEAAADAVGDRTWLELAQAVDARVRSATGKYPNVDFYLAPLYRAAGIPPEFFSAVFAVARVPGWLAHVQEQQNQQGLIRPRAAYVGPRRQEYVPLRRR